VTMPTAPSSIARPPALSLPTGVSKPSLVLLPDRFGATCGSGITFPGQQGWPTGAGRGTPETSCAFAANVLQAYRNSYPSSDNAARTVTAASVVPCPDFGERWSAGSTELRDRRKGLVGNMFRRKRIEGPSVLKLAASQVPPGETVAASAAGAFGAMLPPRFSPGRSSAKPWL
jgi:hypothetical protein